MPENIEEKETEQQEDSSRYKVDAVLAVIPLDPIVVFVSVSDGKNPESPYKSIGIPGFFDHGNKKFITLQGEQITIEGFNEKLVEYAGKLEKESKQD